MEGLIKGTALMDGPGHVVAERPRFSAASGLHHWSSSSGKSRERELVRRLLTPWQRFTCSLIPGWLSSTARSLRRLRRGEPELRLLAGLVDPYRTAVDVGANNGSDTWFLSRLCRHVYAYEPNPAIRWMLKKQRARNVTIFGRALSDHCGEGVLRIPVRRGRYANNEGTLGPAVEGESGECVAVPMSRLDDDGLADVGFVKIDVQGHERKVLSGARDMIARDRPVLLIEIHAEPVQETIDFVERFGYRAHVASGLNLVEWSLAKAARDRMARSGQSPPPVRRFVFLPDGSLAGDAVVPRAVGEFRKRAG
jgi:FkbM family methyltransferase